MIHFEGSPNFDQTWNSRTHVYNVYRGVFETNQRETTHLGSSKWTRMFWFPSEPLQPGQQGSDFGVIFSLPPQKKETGCCPLGSPSKPQSKKHPQKKSTL